MSYEGRVQVLCKNGHYSEYDVYDIECPHASFEWEEDRRDSWSCPVCQAEIAWSNSIDEQLRGYRRSPTPADH